MSEQFAPCGRLHRGGVCRIPGQLHDDDKLCPHCVEIKRLRAENERLKADGERRAADIKYLNEWLDSTYETGPSRTVSTGSAVYAAIRALAARAAPTPNTETPSGNGD